MAGRIGSAIGLDGRRAFLGAAVLVSVLFHLAIVGWAPRTAPDPPRLRERRVAVEPRRLKVPPLAAERPAPATKPIEPPAREPPKEIAKPKPLPRPEPAPPPASKPKPEPPPVPPPATPPKPAPLVLSSVAIDGGVKVQTGDRSVLFGDPSVDAKGWKGVDAPRGPGTAADSGAQAAPHKVVVKVPEPLNDVKGKYPEAHRDLHRVVRVELLLAVDAAGNVGRVGVSKGDLPAFDDEARRTVARLRFRPATRDGVPIPYEVRWTVVFLPEAE